MGVNAQIEVPAFTAGQVLTAAEMTQINTGIPVFATTVTRDAAFGGAGEKVLAQGQYAYIEATSTLQVYTGSAWISAISSGLNLITAQTIGTAVGSVTVSNAFSATYDAYKIVVSGGVGSGNSYFTFKLGASTASYATSTILNDYNATTTSVGSSTGSQFLYTGSVSASSLSASIELQNPFLAKYTSYQASVQQVGSAGFTSGLHQVSTSYTDFILAPASGTLTGGTIRVYGYQNS